MIENDIDITVEIIVNLLANDETRLILCPFPEEETWVFIRADCPIINRFSKLSVESIEVSDNTLKIWLNRMVL